MKFNDFIRYAEDALEIERNYTEFLTEAGLQYIHPNSYAIGIDPARIGASIVGNHMTTDLFDRDL